MTNNDISHLHPPSPSVDRALTVLECLADQGDGLGLADLAQRLGVAKSSLHGILATMHRRDFLDRHPLTKRYTLGPRSLAIGSAYAGRDSLLLVFQSLARDLAAHSGETVQLATRQGRFAFYIGKQDGTQQVRLASNIGSQLPAHATSLGKALLSDLSDDVLDRLYADVVLEPVTANTITSLSKLKRELQRVRNDGYAVDRGEMLSEVRCVAAPVHDAEGIVVAAVSLSVPIFRIDDRREAELAREIRACAAELSLRIGYVPTQVAPHEQTRCGGVDKPRRVGSEGRLSCEAGSA